MVSPVDRTSVMVDNIEKEDIIGSRRLQVAFTNEGASSTIQVLGDLMSVINGDTLRVLILKNCSYGRTIIRNISPLTNLKRLRALILKNFVEELPDSIAKLKQLRYLDLSESYIKMLPMSFTALYKLQTLKLNRCFELELPCNITRKLVNLRQLEAKDVLPPKEISRLRFLQTLLEFKVSKESGGDISELKFLNHLRDKLEIKNLENVESREAAESANLMKKQKIRRLTFTWSYNALDQCNDYDDEVLKGFLPHSNLQGLTINHFSGSKFPTWLKSDANMLPNLVDITLYVLPNCAHLPAFGSFPKLKTLHLSGTPSVTRIGSEFYGCVKPPFPSLKILQIAQLKYLEEWAEAPPSLLSSSSSSSFPLLESLYIRSCPNLTTIPTSFPMLRGLQIYHTNSTVVTMLGTSKVTTLTSLEISNVSNLTQIPPSLLSNNKLLHRLGIENCPMLPSFPTEELQSLAALEELKIGGLSEMLDFFPSLSASDEESGGHQLISSLKTLNLHTFDVTYLPEQIQHFTALEQLQIFSYSSIVALPDCLGSLCSLKLLWLFMCPKLMHLPSVEAMRRLTSLQHLDMMGCPLEERCLKDQGEEWPKISHIPKVFLRSNRITIFRGSILEATAYI